MHSTGSERSVGICCLPTTPCWEELVKEILRLPYRENAHDAEMVGNFITVLALGWGVGSYHTCQGALPCGLHIAPLSNDFCPDVTTWDKAYTESG